MIENRNNLTCNKTNVIFDSLNNNNYYYKTSIALIFIKKTYKLRGATNKIMFMSSTLQSRDVLVTLPEVGQAGIILEAARELGLHPGTFLKKKLVQCF